MRIFYTVTFSIYNYMGKIYPTPDRKLFQNPGNAVQKGPLYSAHILLCHYRKEKA